MACLSEVIQSAFLLKHACLIVAAGVVSSTIMWVNGTLTRKSRTASQKHVNVDLFVRMYAPVKT